MVFRHPSLSVKLFHGRMSGNERKRSMDAQAGSATPPTPELLASQLIRRPAPAAVLVVVCDGARIVLDLFLVRRWPGPAGAAGRQRRDQGGTRWRRWRRHARRQHHSRAVSAPSSCCRPVGGDPSSMMAMPLGPLMSILFSIGFMLMLVKFHWPLALFSSLLCATTAFVIVF